MTIQKSRKPGGGRKRTLSVQQRDNVLKSQLTVKELCAEYSVGKTVIYNIFNDRNKPNKNFIER